MSFSVYKSCLLRLLSVTLSKSTNPKFKIPLIDKYVAAVDPNPPQPTIKIELFKILSWPVSPTFSRII